MNAYTSPQKHPKTSLLGTFYPTQQLSENHRKRPKNCPFKSPPALSKIPPKNRQKHPQRSLFLPLSQPPPPPQAPYSSPKTAKKHPKVAPFCPLPHGKHPLKSLTSPLLPPLKQLQNTLKQPVFSPFPTGKRP